MGIFEKLFGRSRKKQEEEGAAQEAPSAGTPESVEVKEPEPTEAPEENPQM